MTFSFRPAVREHVPILVGFSGGTGSGKTYSAMRMARGMAGDEDFAVIDTENGRAKVYADEFHFDHGELTAPFTPERYLEAIDAADRAGYPVIVVDSFSHEWAGDGGMLDWHDAELDRMAGTDYQKRDACNMAAWIKPKAAHKRLVQRLLQVRAHLILCFRAEPKVEMKREKDEESGRMKTKIVAKQSLVGKDGWIPITEKNLPFEMTAYFLLLASAPGIPEPITLRKPHRGIFPPKQEITEECGRQLAVWAAGAPKEPAAEERPATARTGGHIAPSDSPPPAAPVYVTPDQVANLETLCQDAKVPLERLRKVARVDRLGQILAEDYQTALGWIAKQTPAK